MLAWAGAIYHAVVPLDEWAATIKTTRRAAVRGKAPLDYVAVLSADGDRLTVIATVPVAIANGGGISGTAALQALVDAIDQAPVASRKPVRASRAWSRPIDCDQTEEPGFSRLGTLSVGEAKAFRSVVRCWGGRLEQLLFRRSGVVVSFSPGLFDREGHLDEGLEAAFWETVRRVAILGASALPREGPAVELAGYAIGTGPDGKIGWQRLPQGDF